MSNTEMQAQIDALKAENAKLKAKNDAQSISGCSIRVSEKGAVSVYGLGRFPVTLYREQWLKLFSIAKAVCEFMEAHSSELKVKPVKEPKASVQ